MLKKSGCQVTAAFNYLKLCFYFLPCIFATKPFVVNFGIFVPLFWNFTFFKNRFYWAFRFTSATIDTFLRINVKHIFIFRDKSVYFCFCASTFFILRAMNTIYGANFYTGGITGSYTRFSNNVRHSRTPL